MNTHTVTNQAPPRADLNEFDTNHPLVQAVEQFDAGWALPELHAYDRVGNRIDEVEYHPSYTRIISAAVGFGAHTSAWATPRPGANVSRAAAFMLFSQIEPGHA